MVEQEELYKLLLGTVIRGVRVTDDGIVSEIVTREGSLVGAMAFVPRGE